VCVGLGTRVGDGEPAISPAAVAAHVGRGALVGIVGITALVGLATLGAATTLITAVPVIATSPPVVRKVLGPDVFAESRERRLTIEVGDEAVATPSVEWEPAQAVSIVDLVSVDVESVDTRELVRDWRRSFVALEHAADPATKMALVNARQAFLDELERRDPTGLQEWLESGARAAGDPTKFMTSDGDSGDPHAA
jgi:hypothetical protein